MPKIVFMGTPDFAVPPLKALIKAGFTIPLLLCQPDRKKGRGHQLQFPLTKQLALEHQIEVFQPESLRTPEVQEKLAACEADFFVVIAYGKILPQKLLEIPKKACINVHASLLPKWRGAAPIQFSLLKGDTNTGVCTMLMDEGMDTGDLLLTQETAIDPTEKVDHLSERLTHLGAALIVETLQRFAEIVPQKQDESQATYTRLLKKEDRFIDWSLDAQAIYNHFRALSPIPGVVTLFRRKRLLLKEVDLVVHGDSLQQQQLGEMMALADGGFAVQCGKGMLRVLSCQPESKKEMKAGDFFNGYQIKPGETLGANTLL